MLEPLLAAETVLAVDEFLVALVLELLVPVEEVVGARDVLRVVAASVLAPTSDGVGNLQLRALVVGEVVEVERGSVVSVAVMEVVEVDDVLVVDAPRVDGMPPAEDEQRSDDLVPEFLGVELAVFAMDLRQENLLHVVSGERVGSLALVLAPLLFLLHALENVQHGGVGLAVVLVEGRASVVGEDVVDVAVSLRHVGLASVLPALDEKLLHVLVGDLVLRRNEFVLRGFPLQIVAPRELARVL